MSFQKSLISGGLISAMRPFWCRNGKAAMPRENFYASLIGIGLAFRSHSASEQSVFALIAAGFGVTLATESQTQVHVPGLIYRPIAEDNALVEVKLAWTPDSEEPAVGRFISFMRDQSRTAGAD